MNVERAARTVRIIRCMLFGIALVAWTVAIVVIAWREPRFFVEHGDQGLPRWVMASAIWLAALGLVWRDVAWLRRHGSSPQR